MSEVDVRVRVGETWLNHVWAVLVLEVAPHPPAGVRIVYERSASDYTFKKASMPHARCLVLYDLQGSWNDGETRWIDVLYILAACELAVKENA